MPLNSTALEATDKLRREQITDDAGKPLDAYRFPDLAEDEYIEIKHVRDFGSDNLAEMASLRRMPPVPLDAETPEEAAAKEPVLRRREDVYWWAVFDYMLDRLHVQIDGAWADAQAPRGSEAQRRKVWSAWGPYLQPELNKRFGTIAPLIPDGETNANGGQATFRRHPGSGDTQDLAAVPAGAGAGGARTRAQADSGA